MTMILNSISSFWKPPATYHPFDTVPTPRILVVDVDRDIRNMNKDFLNRSGYCVDTASNLPDAWNRLSSDRSGGYNLLLAEHDLPGINGVELVRKLRAFNHAMPVILVFGMVPKYLSRLDSRLNIRSVIFKPYNLDDLLEAVKQALWEEGSASTVEDGKFPLLFR
jgi:DNA-binding response OmpR family regulator